MRNGLGCDWRTMRLVEFFTSHVQVGVKVSRVGLGGRSSRAAG